MATTAEGAVLFDRPAESNVRLPATLHPLLNAATQRKLQVGVDRAMAAVALARDRALANRMDPANHPLPADAETLERLIRRSIRSVPDLQRMSRQAVARLASTGAVRRRHYGDLAALSLDPSAPVADQVGELQLESPFAPDEALRLRQAAVAVPAGGFSRLELDITRIRCIDKTVNFGELDFADEIVLRVATSSIQLPTASRQRFVGTFGSGDSRAVSPSPFFSFDLRGVAFPVGVVLETELIERDRDLDAPPRGSVLKAAIGSIMSLAVGVLLLDTAYSLTVTAGAASIVAAGALPVTVAGLAVVAAGLAVALGVNAILRTFQSFGENERYPLVRGPQLILPSPAALPADSSVSNSLRFVATSANQGFTGEYRMDYVWRLR